jgi:uncharacterized protein (TIGR00369 family)
MSRLSVKSSDYCFACGKANEHGLRLQIAPTEDGCRTVFTPLRRHEGFAGHTHGGILSTVLDEVIAWACRLQGYDAVTAELTVRFRKPVPINQPVEVLGKVLSERGRLITGEAVLRSEQGEVLALARAKMVR